MRLVKEVFNVIPLRDGVAGIKAGKLPARALAITFDDGYANNPPVAALVLWRTGSGLKKSLHQEFTSFSDGGRMFAMTQ